jgi:ppGpp synthetase/RelA/SpoT-type nucleotidyltranferase
VDTGFGCSKVVVCPPRASRLPRKQMIDPIGNRKYSWDGMSWAVREYSKRKIDKAGNVLISFPAGDPERERALSVINNWRACHSYPLQIIKMTLLTRAKKIDRAVLVAQRLKRLPSIALKLNQNPAMKLSQMQDVGGCRAVMADVRQVHKLVGTYKKAELKNPRNRPILIETYDYISRPKDDGYRGIHLIYKYQSESRQRKVFAGQRIEIQIRSKRQHVWATAVETAQTFTGQALKSRIKSANESWLRFFALMGSAIADWEKQPIVPRTPADRPARVSELRDLVTRENILGSLSAWNAAIRHLEKPKLRAARSFLLTLDPSAGRLNVTEYKKTELALAQEDYLIIEKEFEDNQQVQVVLVSVDSIDSLRKAYPNYYADTTEFIKAVEREIS